MDNNNFFHNQRASVNVRYTNRPAKVVFIVPSHETDTNQQILDGAFCESYSRWGGTSSFIVPFSDSGFIAKSYLKWLEYYDPDFIYSYVDLTKEQISDLNRRALPIEMIRHKEKGACPTWRKFIPDWPVGFEPIKSISTLKSPYARYRGWSHENQLDAFVTQDFPVHEERFLPDNFGVSEDIDSATHGRRGVFSTLCYCAKDVPETCMVGDERCHTLEEVLKKISNKQVKTFLMLSSIHTSSIQHPVDDEWSSAFNLFIGDSVNDRINFWNSRLLSGNETHHLFNALCVSKSYFENENFLKALGAFLNAHNFKRYRDQNYCVQIRSQSMRQCECEEMAQRLAVHTHNHVNVAQNFNNTPGIGEIDLERFYEGKFHQAHSLKLYEQHQDIALEEVDHFKYLPPELYGLRSGQYIARFQIEKPESSDEYIGSYPVWNLPRRIEAAHAFTSNQGKVSRQGTLTILPEARLPNLFNTSSQSQLTVSLMIPDTTEVIRCLVINEYDEYRYQSDMRAEIIRDNKYVGMNLSDKGRKHRGILSLFENKLEATSVLTNVYWRRILRETFKNNQKSYSRENLENYIRRCKSQHFTHITRAEGFSNNKQSKDFVIASLRDTIEYFVHQGVFIQQYSWRCTYCGNNNILTLDTLQIENSCSVCKKTHHTPIDMQWEYKVSPFVISALCEHNGLTVLWAIHYLLSPVHIEQSIYLSEVDVYKNDKADGKNEIDVLAVIDGKFVLAEVKYHAAGFLTKPHEEETFIDEIMRVEPDIACLIFEEYCENPKDKEKFKKILKEAEQRIRKKLPDQIELEVVVVSECEDFDKMPLNIGIPGSRAHAIRDDLPVML